MSKTCPNCGVNSPDNAKFCIECAYSLEDVPINKEEEPPQKEPKSSDDGTNNKGSGLGCIILIAIVVIIIAAAGFFIFGSGGDESPEDISIAFENVYVSDFTQEGITHYDYFVHGFFSNIPGDSDKYTVKTIYYDSQGVELVSTTNKLSQFKHDEGQNYASMISFYQTTNYLDVDHVCVQIIKDNTVIKEFNSTMNKNKLSSVPNPSTNSSNSSK